MIHAIHMIHEEAEEEIMTMMKMTSPMIMIHAIHMIHEEAEEEIMTPIEGMVSTVIAQGAAITMKNIVKLMNTDAEVLYHPLLLEQGLTVRAASCEVICQL